MNLSVYTSLSVLGAALCFGNAYNLSQNISPTSISFVSILFSSRFNILVMLNLSYNLLFLFGKAVQKVFFGKLREVESKNLYDRLLHYILFKIVFLGAIVEPSRELLVFIACFSIIGFMNLFSRLTRDRFEYITTFSPNAHKIVHIKLISLLGLILSLDILWFYVCVSSFREAGTGKLLLITFECFTLFLDTIQTLVKYIIHLIDLNQDGVWEQRGVLIYYTEFFTDTLILSATLLHYLHILIWHGSMHFSLIDLVLFLHLRSVFVNLKDKLTQYRNYRKLADNMKNKYPEVSKEELRDIDDVCAICHDKMMTAKRLPCSHIFHPSCLRSWLEQHNNCPTCRFSLIELAHPSHLQSNRSDRDQAGDLGIGAFDQNEIFGNHNNPPLLNQQLYRFDGSRWFSWLPSVQFQVINGYYPPRNRNRINNDVLLSMVHRVQEVFPHLPANAIMEDLMRTQSVELTTENIIEGRFVTPAHPLPPTTNSNLHSMEQNHSNVESSLETPAKSDSQVNEEINSNNSESLKTNFADEFANSSEERQKRLLSRKQAMLESARRKFMEKSQHDISLTSNGKEEISVPSSLQETNFSSDSSSLEQRRKILYDSAQRRQRQTGSQQF